MKSQMQITSSDLETEPEVKSQIQITNSDLENGENISYVDKDKHRSHKKRKKIAYVGFSCRVIISILLFPTS